MTPASLTEFSDYIVYVDESGDHGLTSINPDYPVFVLAFCIFRKYEYADVVAPAVQRFKFQFFGHDLAILHTHEIRKSKGDFAFLYNREKRERFMEALNTLIEAAPFVVVASVIDKVALQRRYAYPANPYNIALTFCMERAYAFLRDQRQHERETTICVEKRGKAEDDQLELEFRRVADGANRWGRLPFTIRFADKQSNSSGLQLADLIAHPIGRKTIKPDQANRAYDIIESKFRRSPSGSEKGWGLKVFP